MNDEELDKIIEADRIRHSRNPEKEQIAELKAAYKADEAIRKEAKKFPW